MEQMSDHSYVQTAWVVEDIDRTMEHFIATLAIGPFFVMRHVKNETEYQGRPVIPEISIALAQSGSMQIELIQQHDDTASPYRDVPPGLATMHHIGGITADLDADLERFAAQGVEVVYRGTFGATRTAYMDTRPSIGCMTELSELGDDVRDLLTMIADAAADWDGTDPVRIIPT
jgi:hypothetical protein